MPFSLQPKARAAATGSGCRAVVAARLLFPGSEFRVLRALQIANFTSSIANLDPTIERTPPPDTPAPLLERSPDGLTTAEIAARLAQGPDPIPDLDAAEQAMAKLVADDVASRGSLGSDPLSLPRPDRKPAAEHAAAAA